MTECVEWAALASSTTEAAAVAGLECPEMEFEAADLSSILKFSSQGSVLDS